MPAQRNSHLAVALQYEFPNDILFCVQGSLWNQLAFANESLGGGTIVVMAERDGGNGIEHCQNGVRLQRNFCHMQEWKSSYFS